MHRLVMNAERGHIVDHKNLHMLDNREENLCFVTCAQNSQNKLKKKNTTSKYFGIEIVKETPGEQHQHKTN